MAPSTKAKSIGPTPADFLKILAYLKSKTLIHSCQCWFKSSVKIMVESSQQVKVNQPTMSLGMIYSVANYLDFCRERVVFGLMGELLDPIIATSDSTPPAVAEAETFDFWASQLSGVDEGEIVILRDPNGWDCFTPKAKVAELLEKGFKLADAAE